MAQAIWAPKAESDLEQILYYVAVTQRRPEAAKQFAVEFDDTAQEAAGNPALGGRHSATPPDWRYWKCKRWLIFYRPGNDGIEVMRIVDPARDLPQLFGNM